MAGNTIWTINKLITWTTHYFKDHHIESPRLDAEILLAHVLNKSRIYLYTNFDLIVNPDELAMYRGYIKKRIEGYSVAAITGEKEFMGLTFKLSENTLIPRQDTETWLEKVIQYHRNDPELFVADLGSGSGAILLSFLYYCGGAHGVGIDISEDALAIAKENGIQLKMEDRVEWRLGNYLTMLKEGELFDGILSNPPYIPSKDISGLAPEVQREPRIALDGGEDGLDFYRELAKEAANHLKEGGFLAVEYGIGQTQPILDMLKDSGSFEDFEVIKDYGGIERAIYCRKKF